MLTLFLSLSVAKLLKVSPPKHVTAEELHSLVMAKKVTYAAIYKIDPVKFSDLESTMRMLYDHGDKLADNYSSPTVSIVSSAQGVSPRTPS